MRNNLSKYIFFVFVFFGILFIPSGVRALDLKLTYNKNINKCINNVSVLPSYDNNGNMDGYLYVYAGGIMKIDLDNKIVYDTDDYEANADVMVIDETNTEGYKVKGETDLLIEVYDDNDELLFVKQFGGDGIEEGGNVYKSYSTENELDGYLAIFMTMSSDLGVEPGYSMAKFDLKGNIVWTKNVNSYFTMNGLVYSNNNQLFGFRSDGENISKTNLYTNETIFGKNTSIINYGINYSYNSIGNLDGIVVVGFDENEDNGVLIKYDLDGNEVFRVKYDNSNVTSAYSDVISSYLPDGSYDGYIVTGYSYCGTTAQCTNRTFIIKYDYKGNKVFEKVYSDTDTIGFEIVNNYDSTGRQNGYLLYSRAMKLERNIDTYGSTKDCNYSIAKYTYDMFPVVKKEDTGGTITVKSDAYPGELVKVKVVVKEGYSLQRIIVKDENGKEIEVNSDGTFVMPEGKVTVSAIYKRLTNPDTVSAAYMVLGVILIASVGSMIVIKKRSDM